MMIMITVLDDGNGDDLHIIQTQFHQLLDNDSDVVSLICDSDNDKGDDEVERNNDEGWKGTRRGKIGS